ncbi:hypothetical protein ABFX02_10G145100 [Erythranthe guttata]
MARKGNFLNKLIQLIFYTHLTLIAILVIALTLRGVLSSKSSHAHNFHPKKLYPLILSPTACAGILGLAWQSLATLNPSKTLKATFWLSPLLTCSLGILLVLIGSPGGLALSVIALIFSIFQSLYACWVNHRFEHASRILTVSIASQPPKVKAAAILSIVVSTLYSSFLISGIGGATAIGTKLDTLFIVLILGSLAWTTQIIKNMIQVTVSHIKYMKFSCSIEVDFQTVVKSAAKYSMGSVCLGSILVPICCVIRGFARGVSLISGDVDEVMFSCADCCTGVGSRIVEYGNRWGFVHVGVYNKGIVQASMDVWELFKRVGIEKLIDRDLTSSFCFLSGVGAGSVCALLGGTWALVIYKNYATEVCIYAFLTGYFTNRVAMAWVQASVSAYYVAYAENPQSQQFDTTIPAYVHELQRSEV